MILPCIYPSTNETLHICNLIANEKKHSSERDTIRYFYVVRWYNHDMVIQDLPIKLSDQISQT
jgi:hypothetical protein